MVIVELVVVKLIVETFLPISSEQQDQGDDQDYDCNEREHTQVRLQRSY